MQIWAILLLYANTENILRFLEILRNRNMKRMSVCPRSWKILQYGDQLYF